jgi:hypothetical protein
VFSDHASERDGPLILHCGMLMMLGCPISVSWDVSHREGLVEIKNVVKVPTVNQGSVLRFPEADTTLTRAEYGRPILRLADEVAAFFSASRPRRLADDYEYAGFESFLKEFDEKREQARALLR